MRPSHHRLSAALAGCGLLLAAALSAADPASEPQRGEPLDAAKTRYGAAAYDEALTILDAAKPAESDRDMRAEIEKYRTLCLLALGRKADAEQAMERLVTLNPSLGAEQLNASPWVRETFRTVRRRVLPGVVGQKFELAKDAVLQKSFQEASGQLKEVLALLDDPDLAASDERWRRDLRTLVQGFLDLAGAASAAPGPPSSPPIASAQPAAAPAADSTIVPAVAVREDVPQWPARLSQFMGERETATGVIEVTVDEKGAVASAVILEPIHPVYDALLITATRAWRYHPATRGGVPVPGTRRVRVVVHLR